MTPDHESQIVRDIRSARDTVLSGEWRWTEDRRWVWAKDPDAVQAQTVIRPTNEPPPLDGEFREHRTVGGSLWVPAAARLHDVPFGFQGGGRG